MPLLPPQRLVLLTFDNAMTYNDAGDEYWESARRLKTLALSVLPRVVKAAMAPRSTPTTSLSATLNSSPRRPRTGVLLRCLVVVAGVTFSHECVVCSASKAGKACTIQGCSVKRE